MLRFLTVLLVLVPSAAFADAAGERCWLVSDGSATSIAGGAITTAELATIPPGAAYPSPQTPLPSRLKVGVDLVDANSSVTDLTFTFTGLESSGGSARAVARTGGTAAAALTRSWNPANGKNFVVVLPWKHPYGKVTVTPTGHGAGDTVALKVYGCTAGGTP